MTRDEIVELSGNPDLLFCDGYDDCILGVVERFCDHGHVEVVLYDKERMLSKLAGDMTWDEAMEFFEFNIAGAYMGEYTPAFATITTSLHDQ